MYKREEIIQLAEEKIMGTDLYLVDVIVRPGNSIEVIADSDAGIQIHQCRELSSYIEHKLDRETEDFELMVASPGLGLPFKILRQYQKNIGQKVEIITSDGMKYIGILMACNDSGIEVETEVKVKPEGKKRFEFQKLMKRIEFKDIKTTKNSIDF